MKQLLTERKAPICYMSEDNRTEIAINMIEEMLEQAEQADKKHKAEMIAKGQGEQAIGESWLIWNLKTLKDLLKNGPV